MSDNTTALDLGDLHPVREVLTWVEEWEKQDAARRPGDVVVHTLGEVRRRLSQALDEATNADLTITPEDLAKREGVTRWAIYKRIQSGALKAVKRGGAIRIPVGQP